MGNIDAARDELYRLNQPTHVFKEVEEHFWANLDETCLMACEGTVKVIASIKKAKTEIVKDDSRCSITCLRIGFASGTSGPLFFLAKGRVMDRISINRLMRSDGVPAGSKVIMTPNAFMNDETWLKIVPQLCEAIRKLPVIRDHPNWWTMISLDGFGSHCNVDEAQFIFAKYRILVLKEEADTSHVNQAYDQSVAKKDKTMMRTALATVRDQLAAKIDQWYLIAIAIEALKKVGAEPWIQSFKKVNMHPKFRIPADQWLKVLDTRGVLSAERFFDHRQTLYDAMPAVWKKLTPEERQDVCSIIRSIYNEPGDTPVWTKDKVVRLAKYCPLEEVYKLRACYHASLTDPSVLVRTEEEKCDVVVEDDNGAIDNWCSWKPDVLVQQYKEDQNNKDIQQRWFNHVCDMTASHHWLQEKPVEPSHWLDVHITKQQKDFLNPTIKQVTRGFILYDVKGKGAKELHAKRHLDMISGNVSSYSRMMNDAKRLKEITELSSLVAACAQVTADKDQAKEKSKEDKEEALRKKEAKKQAEKVALAAERERLLPELSLVMEPYMAGQELKGTTKLTLPILRQVVQFYFCRPKKGFKTWNKNKLCEYIRWLITCKNNMRVALATERPDELPEFEFADGEKALEEAGDESDEDN